MTETAITLPKRILIRLPSVSTEIEIPQAWIRERDELVARVAQIETVTEQVGFDQACQLLAHVTKASNKLEDERKKLAKPFREADATIKAAADSARQSLEQAKEKLKTLTGAYAEQQRRAQEADRRRIEEEQRRQIEEQAAQRVAEEDLGVTEEAEVFAPAVTTPEPTVEVARSSAARVIERLVWEAVNEDAVPRGFMSIDSVKVNEHIRNNKEFITKLVKDGQGEQVITGLKFTIKTDVAAR